MFVNCRAKSRGIGSASGPLGDLSLKSWRHWQPGHRRDVACPCWPCRPAAAASTVGLRRRRPVAKSDLAVPSQQDSIINGCRSYVPGKSDQVDLDAPRRHMTESWPCPTTATRRSDQR